MKTVTWIERRNQVSLTEAQFNNAVKHCKLIIRENNDGNYEHYFIITTYNKFSMYIQTTHYNSPLIDAVTEHMIDLADVVGTKDMSAWYYNLINHMSIIPDSDKNDFMDQYVDCYKQSLYQDPSYVEVSSIQDDRLARYQESIILPY
jgi:hypothetical protein